MSDSERFLESSAQSTVRINTQYHIYCISRFRMKDKCGIIVFSKAQPTTLLHLLYFEASASQGIAFTVISKALPSEVSSLLMLPRLNRANYRVYFVFARLTEESVR